MNLLKTPLWDLSDIENLDQHQNYIRLRLFQDDFIAECSLYELLWFFGIKDASTLHKQFKVWNKVEALEWIQEGSIYQETLPFADYWDVTRVQLTSTNHPQPDSVDGVYIFGSKKK
ncbi:hypothetical protein N24_2551 [Corynebacterium suranareeae]|uniref:Uncharacterized protein n=1 Tax=Corynebacterium suranareeae TaxID=2506452 RepID=A0A160PU11_9CORY|nr:hypothetical protein [Corynebacterium suranareeae]BAU96813.1 hypothetical protein N24_2551 [Corynebacterium suranareeae]